MLESIALETSRMYLREIRPDDLQAMYRDLSDPEVTWAYGRTLDDAQVRRWLSSQLIHYRQDGFGMWAAVLKKTGEIIGHAGVCVRNEDGKRLHEIGYMLDKHCWGQGYATELASACCDFALDILGVSEIACVVRHDNHASRAVARRSGMKITTTEYVPINGQPVVHYRYTLATNRINN